MISEKSAYAYARTHASPGEPAIVIDVVIDVILLYIYFPEVPQLVYSRLFTVNLGA